MVCTHTLQGTKIGLNENSLRFKIVEESGECQLNVKFENEKFIYSECKTGQILISNVSEKFKISNAFISCSHPLLFSFENTKLVESLDPGKEF